jgi:hypothetical protein
MDIIDPILMILRAGEIGIHHQMPLLRRQAFRLFANGVLASLTRMSR